LTVETTTFHSTDKEPGIIVGLIARYLGKTVSLAIEQHAASFLHFGCETLERENLTIPMPSFTQHFLLFAYQTVQLVGLLCLVLSVSMITLYVEYAIIIVYYNIHFQTH